MVPNSDRRRFQRVTLPQPVQGTVGTTRVYVIDASLGGVRIAHQGVIPKPGEFLRVELPSELGPIKLDCEVVRTSARPAASNAPATPLFHSGLAIIGADHQSAQRLRIMFGAAAASRGKNEHEN